VVPPRELERGAVPGRLVPLSSWNQAAIVTAVSALSRLGDPDTVIRGAAPSN